MPLPSDDGSLESLIEQSLRQVPSFPALATKKLSLKQRIIRKLPAISAAAIGAACSINGNPVGTPLVMGAVTYALADRAFGMYGKDKLSGKRTLGSKSPPAHEGFFGLKRHFSAFSAAAGLAASVGFFTKDMNLSSDVSDFYSGLVPYLPGMLPGVSYALVNGLGAYIMLSASEKALHPDSISVVAGRAKNAFYRLTKQKKKAAASPEQMVAVPHSKEKEVAAFLQLGNAYLDAGLQAEAVNAYKMLLGAAKRDDEFSGVSDWLVWKAGKRPDRSHEGKSVGVKVQRAMHEFAAGNYAAANEGLKKAVAAEPENRQLRRIRALFFDATKNDAQADLEMRIYEGLLMRDKSMTFKVLGESRNEVLVPKDETEAMPDVYIKRSKSKASLDEEVRNIAAFSVLLSGRLPRVIRQGFDGEYYHIVLESLGMATMHRKALKGVLTYSDVKSAVDLLVDVVAAGKRLSSEGKISVSEPVTAEKYSYSTTDSEQLNFSEGQGSTYFTHRLVDIFASRVEKSNKVRFDNKFLSAFISGAAVINETLFRNNSLNFVYTDFTPRNIIFSSLLGSLTGKIDWELIRKAPVALELVNIIEFYGSNLGCVARNELTEHFIRRMESEMQLKISRKSFRPLYEVAATARHLELVGYMSRDSETNQEYNKAQVYNLMMARMHLANIIRCAEKESRQPLEEMLLALEVTPILKDEALQRQLEKEIRPQLQPSMAYSLHWPSQKRYLLELKPKRLIEELRQPLVFKVQDMALPAVALVGVPATLGALAAYGVVSYNVIGAIMPSLPVP